MMPPMPMVAEPVAEVKKPAARPRAPRKPAVATNAAAKEPTAE